MWYLLYSTSSILLNVLGGGNHVHIDIFMQDTLYAKISTAPYNAPVDPEVLEYKKKLKITTLTTGST